MSQRRSPKHQPSTNRSFLQGLASFFGRLFSKPSATREGLARNTDAVVGTSEPERTPSPFVDKGVLPLPSDEPDQPRSGHPARLTPKHQAANQSPRGFWPVFWTVSGTLSILLNIILIAGLLILGRQLFVLKALVSDDLLSGLYENFVLMDDATIKTSVHVTKDIPVTFDLPLEQDTVVTLTQSTSIYGANVALNSGGIAINAPADIILPLGQELPVHLSLSVPVSVTVPVELDVPVSIPLSTTELHEPFVGLRTLIGEFYNDTLPNIQAPEDLVFCQSFPSLCELYFK